MSNAYVGEIRMFAGNFAPVGWALCNGQTMDITQNTTLFTLIGTTFGGDGQTTFNLPNLQSCVPIHQGTNQFGSYILGQLSGEESVTLTANQMPVHNHELVVAAIEGGQTGLVSPANNVWGPWAGDQYASSITSAVTMQPSELGNVGGSQPHDNMIPFVVVTFIISLFGIFPSQG
jgi:microcystin-dependent protein